MEVKYHETTQPQTIHYAALHYRRSDRVDRYVDKQSIGVYMNIAATLSSKDMNWETPQELFNQLNAEFRFHTDVCATSETAKCKNYYTPETDGLKQEWIGPCWMNPPYGKQIGSWLQKAYNESLKGATVVCLIPSRTDTKYWHEYVMKASEIRFIKGRLKFGNAIKDAPFPSAIVVFKGGNANLTVSTYHINKNSPADSQHQRAREQ